MTEREAIKELRRYCNAGNHPAGYECKTCDALDLLVKAAEESVALKMALAWRDNTTGCVGCPAWDTCRKGPEGSGPFGRLLCTEPMKNLPVWVEAARKEVTP